MHAELSSSDLYNISYVIFKLLKQTHRVTNVTSALRRANLSFLEPSPHAQNMSSSPLPIPSSDDDVAMAIDDELPQTPTPHGGQSMSQAPPPPADPLFLTGTPSTQAGTPLRGVVARRAVGVDSTPRRNVAKSPLFARKWLHLLSTVSVYLTFLSSFISAGSSSPAQFPSSSSPARNVYRTSGGRASSRAGSNLDSEPLDFPSQVPLSSSGSGFSFN